jgi:hypothetical protein
MCPVPPDDDRLTARQQAALSSIEAAHPCPVTTAELAAELLVAEGALNVTLRSLQSRRLIAGIPATANRRCGWTLPQ